MLFTPQISNWEPQQIVTAAEMLLYANDIYQRLGVMEPVKPFILRGLDTSIDESGTVTVTAGTAISPDMNNSDNPDVPANGVQVIGTLVEQGSVNVTATGVEFGLVVLRQSLASIENTPNFQVISTLVYIPGSSTTYPELGLNDVPLAGVYTSGTYPALGYALDFGRRAVSLQTYYKSIQGVDHFQNGNFYDWPIGDTSTFSGVSAQNYNYSPVARHWYAQAATPDNTSFDVTFSRVTLDESVRALIPNYPEFGMQIERTSADGNTQTFDYLAQLAQPYYALNGKILTVSFYAFATAAGETLQTTLAVAYNAQNSTETVLTPFTTPLDIIADGVPRLYTFTYAIPEIQDTVGTHENNYIAVKIGIGRTNQTYTCTICEAHNCEGAMYVEPPANLVSYQGTDLGKIEMGSFDVSNVGFGYIPFVEGTIGNIGSEATIAANYSVGQYYCQLWNMTSSNPDSAPVDGGRGASALEDWLAGKPMGLLRNAGMVWGNAGAGIDSQGIITSDRDFGVPTGEEDHPLTGDENGPHTHPPEGTVFLGEPGGLELNSGGAHYGEFSATGSSGLGTPHNTMQPTNFCTMRIKL